MASPEQLTADQRALLQLLLRQGKSYGELAELLKTDPGSLRARARAAVAAIAPAATEIGEQRRDEVADYLLGQQTASQRAATREFLRASRAGRAWARAASGALGPLAAGELPDVPAEREEVAQAFDALDRRTARRQEVRRSSQLGTRLVYAGLGVVLAVVIIVVMSVTGDEEQGERAATTTTAPTQTAPAQRFDVLASGTLRPPEGSGSDARGEIAIVRFRDTEEFRFALQATGLPPSSTRGSAYGVWLYTSPSVSEFLGFPDATVGRDGRLETITDLSGDTRNYREVLLTRETAETPERPGAVVLRGRLVYAVEGDGATRTQTQP